jgi:hypothetical protein
MAVIPFTSEGPSAVPTPIASAIDPQGGITGNLSLVAIDSNTDVTANRNDHEPESYPSGFHLPQGRGNNHGRFHPLYNPHLTLAILLDFHSIPLSERLFPGGSASRQGKQAKT